MEWQAKSITSAFFLNLINANSPSSQYDIRQVRVPTLLLQMNCPNPLLQLRNAMKKANINAFIVPTEDAHQSEYIAKSDNRRAFISNFTGSAGTCVVTLTEACLWTDGRYYLQASQQLSREWKLQKFGLPSTPSKEDWLLDTLEPKSKVGVDPKLITFLDSTTLKQRLTAAGHELVSIPENLVDSIWTDRPPPPKSRLLILETKYAGQDHHAKIKLVQKQLEINNAWGLLVSALDDIAWLFNLRGSDIQFNPVFHSYALITTTDVILYIDPAKVTLDVKSHLGSVLTRPYDQVFDDLKQTKVQDKPLLIDSRCSLALVESYGLDKPLLNQPKPIIQFLKAIKNSSEQQGFRDCHIRDATALIKYLSWLQIQLDSQTEISEAQGADKLESFRSNLSFFQGLSFDTISSTGPNGAIIHYKPEHGTCAVIRKDQMYLVDSGGQYLGNDICLTLDGTTDVTRTLHFGNPREEEKDAFTRVLKGHIQLDVAVILSNLQVEISTRYYWLST
jgi:Xaa-Pro aminopeptidase